MIPGHLAQAQQMATQFNPTNPAKSNQFWDFSTKRFASRFFFQVQILGGQSANCHRFFPLQIRAPKASVCGGMVFASDNNSLETFWKPFPKSLTLLVHHSIFPGKDEHGIFCHCYLTLTEGLFCHHRICKKKPWCKILPRHKPNVWKHLTHGEAAQLHPLVLRRGSQGILGNLCWRTWKSSATEKHRFKDHGKVCFNTRLLNTRAKNSKSPQRNMTIQF